MQLRQATSNTWNLAKATAGDAERFGMVMVLKNCGRTLLIEWLLLHNCMVKCIKPTWNLHPGMGTAAQLPRKRFVWSVSPETKMR
jgi:hypothetical protein